MTRKTSEPAAAEQAIEQDMEQPGAGGSYVRQADGSLKRVEFTAEAPPANAPPADEDGTAPPDPKTPDPKTPDQKTGD